MELKKAIVDESYFERTVVIKDMNHRMVDPTLSQPLKFDAESNVELVWASRIFWNIPMIFCGFYDEKKSDLYAQFQEILKINPSGPFMTSCAFLDYMVQPVIFWVKEKHRIEDSSKEYTFEDDLFFMGQKHRTDVGEYKTFFLRAGPYSKNMMYDMLEYKIMNNNITEELFDLFRASYLRSIGRELVEGEDGSKKNYLKPR